MPPLVGDGQKDARASPRVRPPETCRLSCAHPRRSGRVAEGGALLRRYGGECLHRGFESLLLRFWTIVVSIRLRLSGAATDRTRAPFMLLGRRRDRTQH